MAIRPSRPSITGLLSASILLLAGAGPAGAATGYLRGELGAVSYGAGALTTPSDLTVSYSNGRYVFEDRGVDEIVVAGPDAAEGCQRGSAPNIATCVGDVGAPYGFLWQFIIRTGSDDDRVTVDGSLPASFVAQGGSDFFIDTGAGADTVVFQRRGDTTRIRGGDGNDVLIGGPGSESMLGGQGNDTLRGGGSSDGLDGGEGRDGVSYGSEGRTSGVRAVLDGATRSGSEAVDGIGDVLFGFEDVLGTPYADVITGNASNNILRGAGGADRIDGLGGDDTITATGGPSWVDGGDGNDSVQVKNTFKDFVSCGAGTDTALVDPTELFLPFAGCETLG